VFFVVNQYFVNSLVSCDAYPSTYYTTGTYKKDTPPHPHSKASAGERQALNLEGGIHGTSEKCYLFFSFISGWRLIRFFKKPARFGLNSDEVRMKSALKGFVSRKKSRAYALRPRHAT